MTRSVDGDHLSFQSTGGTPSRLLDALKRAARHKMPPDEKRAQRISFIHGQTGVDKDRISEILDGK